MALNEPRGGVRKENKGVKTDSSHLAKQHDRIPNPKLIDERMHLLYGGRRRYVEIEHEFGIDRSGGVDGGRERVLRDAGEEGGHDGEFLRRVEMQRRCREPLLLALLW
jgi:hypothetical protein